MPEELRITTDDGVELAVHVTGEGPALVLVHGFGGAKEDFADHVEALAAEHLVVTFDHRGHGASAKPPTTDEYSFPRLQADVLCVADALGLDRFRVLGHSMGGMVSRRLPLDHAHRVDALVLMDTSAGPLPEFTPELIEIAARVALDEGKDALKALLDAAAPLDNPAYQRVLAERPGYQEFLDRKWDDLSPVMWAALGRAIAAQADDLLDLAGVECPVLVVVGEQDAPFLGCARAMAATIPGARLAVIPGAGHSPQIENADAWFAAVAGFLAEVEREPGAAPGAASAGSAS